MVRALQYVNVSVMCLLALILSAELMTQIWPSARLVESAQGQDAGAKRMVLIQMNNPYAPVKVVKVTENGETIIPGRAITPEVAGKRFSAGEDWISNLSFVVRNRTKLRIAYMSIGIAFGEDQHYDKVLHLGQVPAAAAATYYRPPHTHVPEGTGRPLQLGPGEEMTISLSDYVESIKSAKRTDVPFSSLTKCSILIWDVYLEDQGLRWAFGMDYLHPDPDSPKGYSGLPWGYFPGDRSQYSRPDWTDFRVR